MLSFVDIAPLRKTSSRSPHFSASQRKFDRSRSENARDRRAGKSGIILSNDDRHLCAFFILKAARSRLVNTEQVAGTVETDDSEGGGGGWKRNWNALFRHIDAHVRPIFEARRGVKRRESEA